MTQLLPTYPLEEPCSRAPAPRGLRTLCETDYLDDLIEIEIHFPELSEGR